MSATMWILASDLWMLRLLCALPFLALGIIPASIIIFDITLWLQDRRPRR
jgi:hypothetical protein